MSEEIQIPMDVAPSPAGVTSSFGYLSRVNSNYVSSGIYFPNAVDSKCYIRLAGIIPSTVNGTPNGLMRVYYKTPAASGNLKLELNLWEDEVGVTDTDPAGSPDFNDTQTVVPGSGDPTNVCEFDLASIAASLVAGRMLFGNLKRSAGTDAGDTCEDDVVIEEVVFFADE